MRFISSTGSILGLQWGSLNPLEKGKLLSGGEKAEQSAETLGIQPHERLCSLLLLWLLICQVSYHQLSFAFEMLIYTSAVLHNFSAILPGGPGVGELFL